MANFTPAEQSVFDALIKHGSSHEEASLPQLASECHVAKSTVVKTMKKLGFKGYRDFVYSYRLHSSIPRDRLVPRGIVAGDLEKEAERLACWFAWGRGRKNIIYSGAGADSTLPLATAISRKLTMFDLFAPASYDYALMDRMRLEPGFALLFPGAMAGPTPSESVLADMWRNQITFFRRRGFRTISIPNGIALSDAPDADYVVHLVDTRCPHGEIDLYATRVLALFELALSRFACGVHDDPSHAGGADEHD